jgi:hypothetical protein
MGAMRSLLKLLPVLSMAFAAAACAAPTDAPSEGTEGSEDDLVAKADEHWFYNGTLPKLEGAKVTVSLKGHTARVSGLLPAGVTIGALPHVMTKPEGARTRVDVVYPIATAMPGKSNSRPGAYEFQLARPYRPDGVAYTIREGEHFVPWGGFPFIAYNGGIAFHGPITSKDNLAAGDLNVWYLRRGAVSGGCNRMMGEHVVELAHLVGINMRKVYEANRAYQDPSNAAVQVIADYDKYNGKYVDVDYPTDEGARRPKAVFPANEIAMFGSWIATEMPDGKDLPPSMKWEAGVQGDFYVFAEHAKRNVVCSIPKRDLPRLKTFVATRGGEVPQNLCEKKACYIDALRAGRTPACN